MERANASALTHGLSEAEMRAIEGSYLRSLSPQVLADLTADAVRLEVQPGVTIHREGDTEAHVRLVVSGLVRMYVTAIDGSTFTWLLEAMMERSGFEIEEAVYSEDGIFAQVRRPGGVIG